MNKIDLNSTFTNTAFESSKPLELKQNPPIQDQGIAIPSSFHRKKSTFKRFAAESGPALQRVPFAEKNLQEKKFAKIAKITIEERPIADVVESYDGKSDYVFQYSYYNQPYFSVFVTLENGDRYFAPEVWARSVEECKALIPSHLAIGHRVEIVSLPYDPWYRNFPKIAFKGGNDQLSPDFIKF